MEELNADFWNTRYVNDQIGWDLGGVSPALKCWIDQLNNKSARILIPGAGNAYEVDYLIEQGFQDITVIDIAPKLVRELQERYGANDNVTILLGDFFELEGEFDVILEQTFFCAIDPKLRSAYVNKMAQLLTENGALLGVLFNRDFVGGPPFGGNVAEYHELFKQQFNTEFIPCEVSHPARMGSEVLLRAFLRH
jgi:SAM-dependent methyltransferase